MENLENMKGKKAILLLSSGFDSSIAGYLMIKQGMIVDGLHLMNKDEINPKVKQLITHLNKITTDFRHENHPEIKLHTVPFKKIQETFQEECDKSVQCIFCKRTMVKIAEIVAKKEGYDYILMGDNLGQVASQTMENMKAISKITELPILRPLLAMDKTQIMDIAREIGTYDISKIAEPECPFLPTGPKTKAKSEYMEKQEARIPLKELLEEIQ